LVNSEAFPNNLEFNVYFLGCYILNGLPGARSSECVQAQILEYLGQAFKVLPLLLRQMCHGGLDHVLDTYV
jgi:hypothetical protein